MFTCFARSPVALMVRSCPSEVKKGFVDRLQPVVAKSRSSSSFAVTPLPSLPDQETTTCTTTSRRRSRASASTRPYFVANGTFKRWRHIRVTAGRCSTCQEKSMTAVADAPPHHTSTLSSTGGGYRSEHCQGNRPADRCGPRRATGARGGGGARPRVGSWRDRGPRSGQSAARRRHRCRAIPRSATGARPGA